MNAVLLETTRSLLQRPVNNCLFQCNRDQEQQQNNMEWDLLVVLTVKSSTLNYVSATTNRFPLNVLPPQHHTITVAYTGQICMPPTTGGMYRRNVEVLSHFFPLPLPCSMSRQAPSLIESTFLLFSHHSLNLKAMKSHFTAAKLSAQLGINQTAKSVFTCFPISPLMLLFPFALRKPFY